MGFKGKVPILILAVMLLASCFMLSSTTETAATGSSRTITVPDDFSNIQDAVGNATAGDTVYVKSGTYELPEKYTYSLVIGESISLVGENPETTIIVTKQMYTIIFGWSYGIALHDNSSISGFTITGDYHPLILLGNGKITSNIINLTASGSYAIYTLGGGVISSNIINGGRVGMPKHELTNGNIGIHSHEHTIISNNLISGFGTGIWVWGSNVTILNNTLTYNNVGITARATFASFEGNNIVNSSSFGFYGLGTFDVPYNWWGTNDTQEVANLMTTGNHDGNITFLPILTEPNPQAEPIQKTDAPPTSGAFVEKGVFWVAVVIVLFIVVVVTVVFLKRKQHTPVR